MQFDCEGIFLQKCDKKEQQACKSVIFLTKKFAKVWFYSIINIEVKSNKSTNNTSLTRYNEKFKNDLSIRLSMNNLSKDDKILNIPLFLIEYINQIIFWHN